MQSFGLTINVRKQSEFEQSLKKGYTMNPNSNNTKGNKSQHNMIGAGIALGVGVGVAVGSAIGNVSAGIAIGVALGIAFGVVMQKKKDLDQDVD